MKAPIFGRGFRVVAWTLAGVVAIALLSACTLAVGATGEVYQMGFPARVRVAELRCGRFVERTTLGLDLRINTGDPGLAVGWSRRMRAEAVPGGETAGCWRKPPDAGSRLAELAPLRRYPLLHGQGDGDSAPLFLGTATAGLSVELGGLRTGLSLGVERSSLTVVDPEGDLVCHLHYASGALGDFYFVSERPSF